MTVEQILNYKLSKALTTEKYNTVTAEDKNFILAQAKTKIQSYCHRIDIPEEAFYVWADMAIELLKGIDKTLFEVENNKDLMDKVTGVKVGDTSLTIAKDSEDNSSNNDLDTDAILVAFRKQLQNFRKFSSGNGSVVNGI